MGSRHTFPDRALNKSPHSIAASDGIFDALRGMNPVEGVLLVAQILGCLISVGDSARDRLYMLAMQEISHVLSDDPDE